MVNILKIERMHRVNILKIERMYRVNILKIEGWIGLIYKRWKGYG